MTLSDLEQVKVLADPLRIRILEELCTAERTTKQVAERLGERPTKLYHHVDALARVGLIRLTRTRQNRGTLEKYYLAVARQFRADGSLFSGAEAEKDAAQAMISTFLERTAGELRALVTSGSGQAGLEERGILSFLEIHADAQQGAKIRARLMRLVESLAASDGTGPAPGQRRYRLTLAFYPLDPDP